MNNLLFNKNPTNTDKEGNIISRSKSPRMKKVESERDNAGVEQILDKERVKIDPKKRNTINLNNKYNYNPHNHHHHQQHPHNLHNQQHHYNNYNRYGIYPSDKNNQNLKDRHLINTLKSSLENNKVKTKGAETHDGHNHSLSISVVTINDEIVFNSEQNPTDNLFNLDDTEVSRSKMFKKIEETIPSAKNDKKGGNNNPIIQFNQFNTFQVKQESNNNNQNSNKLNFFGTTNYDKIFEQPQSSKNTKNRNTTKNLMYPSSENEKSNKNNAPSLNNLKNALITPTPPQYEFGANIHHDEGIAKDALKTAKLFEYDYLLTDVNTRQIEKPDTKEKIYFFDFFKDTKKKRSVKSVDLKNKKEINTEVKLLI